MQNKQKERKNLYALTEKNSELTGPQTDRSHFIRPPICGGLIITTTIKRPKERIKNTNFQLYITISLPTINRLQS